MADKWQDDKEYNLRVVKGDMRYTIDEYLKLFVENCGGDLRLFVKEQCPVTPGSDAAYVWLSKIYRMLADASVETQKAWQLAIQRNIRMRLTLLKFEGLTRLETFEIHPKASTNAPEVAFCRTVLSDNLTYGVEHTKKSIAAKYKTPVNMTIEGTPDEPQETSFLADDPLDEIDMAS